MGWLIRREYAIGTDFSPSPNTKPGICDPSGKFQFRRRLPTFFNLLFVRTIIGRVDVSRIGGLCRRRASRDAIVFHTGGTSSI